MIAATVLGRAMGTKGDDRLTYRRFSGQSETVTTNDDECRSDAESPDSPLMDTRHG